jgi:hypothetical protein
MTPSGGGVEVLEGSPATVFTWPGVVPDSLYLVGMRPVKAIIFVDHGTVLDTLRLQ